MIAVLVVLVLGVGLSHPDFLRRGNLLSTAQSSVYVGLMAVRDGVPARHARGRPVPRRQYALGIVVGAVLIRDGSAPWLALPAILLAAPCSAASTA